MDRLSRFFSVKYPLQDLSAYIKRIPRDCTCRILVVNITTYTSKVKNTKIPLLGW